MKKDSLSDATYRSISKINKIYTQTLLNIQLDSFEPNIELAAEKRITILAYHADVEREMTMLLSYYFAYRHNRKEIWELQELVFDKLGFEAKRQLIKKLKFFNGDSEVYKKLDYLNQARNSVAHSAIWESPKTKTSQEKILTKDSLMKIKNDYNDLRKKFYAYDWALREGLDIKHF